MPLQNMILYTRALYIEGTRLKWTFFKVHGFIFVEYFTVLENLPFSWTKFLKIKYIDTFLYYFMRLKDLLVYYIHLSIFYRIRVTMV